MPTGDDYRDGAARLRALARFADEHAMALVSNRDLSKLGVGPVAVAVDAELDEAAHELHSAQHGLIDLAALCDRRAELCDRALLDWRAAHGVVDAGYDGTPRLLARHDWIDLPDAWDAL